MYPKARLDTLADGIFAVAMTLLIHDARRQDELALHDDGDLIAGLVNL